MLNQCGNGDQSNLGKKVLSSRAYQNSGPCHTGFCFELLHSMLSMGSQLQPEVARLGAWHAPDHNCNFTHFDQEISHDFFFNLPVDSIVVAASVLSEIFRCQNRNEYLSVFRCTREH